MNNQFLRVLSIKPFLYLWLAEIFSQIASNMVNFVLIVLVYNMAHSNTAVSGIVLAFTIPAIIFGLFAGVLVDVSEKKQVLFLTNAIRAVLLIFLAVFHSNLLSIYALTFIIALVTQFFIPAETPMIPSIVDKSLLLTANALFGIGIYASVIIGFALSGLFLIVFGSTNVFLVLAFFFIIASFFISKIKIPFKKNNNTRLKSRFFTSMFKEEITNVLGVIRKTKIVYQSLLLLSFSQILILILAVLGPGFAKQILEIEVNQFSYIFVAPAAVGVIIGAILVGNYLHNYSKHTMVTIGLFISAASIFFLPYSSKMASRDFINFINNFLPNIFQINIIHIVVLVAFILGVANALVFVPTNTTIQEETTDEVRGKIYGLNNSLVGVFSLFPIIVVGSLADMIGVSSVLYGIGSILLLIGIIIGLFK